MLHLDSQRIPSKNELLNFYQCVSSDHSLIVAVIVNKCQQMLLAGINKPVSGSFRHTWLIENAVSALVITQFIEVQSYSPNNRVVANACNNFGKLLIWSNNCFPSIVNEIIIVRQLDRRRLSFSVLSFKKVKSLSVALAF